MPPRFEFTRACMPVAGTQSSLHPPVSSSLERASCFDVMSQPVEVVMSTRVLLVDDHAMVRHGLRKILEHDAGFVVVGEAQDGAEAVRLAQSEDPDVILIDLSTASGCGHAAIAQMIARSPRTSVLAMSMDEGTELALAALRAGARGYLAKSAPADELRVAIETVQAGRIYLSPAIAGQVIAALAGVSSGIETVQTTLTPREREVMMHAVEGSSAKEIGAVLGISPRTVETHRARLMKKLGVHKTCDLVRIAIREGLLPV